MNDDPIGKGQMFLSLLESRRSIRRFQDCAVEGEKVAQLVEALLRAPSSRGRNPWQFVVVEEPQRIKRLAASKAHGSAFLEGAPLAVVVCGNPDRSDVWIEDCSIAAVILQLAAQGLGLGSCWVQIRLRQRQDGQLSEDYLRSQLGLPDDLRVLAVVGIGYPDETKPGHARDSLDWDHIHRNQFGSAWQDETGA